MCLTSSASADSIDPKQSCGTLARAIGEANSDQVVNALQSDSRGAMDQGSAVAVTEQIVPFVKQQGQFVLAETMGQREYGERYRRDWYLIIFEGSQSLFLVCEYLKPDDAWQLINIKFNSDFDKLPVP
jgi:hypothetical protein